MADLSAICDEDFDSRILASQGPILLDFWAPWCMPCKAMAPVLEGLAEDYAGRLEIAKIDVDSNALSRDRFRVRSIPTQILFRDGCELARLTGAMPRSKLMAFLDGHLAPVPARVAAGDLLQTRVFDADPRRQVEARARLAAGAAQERIVPGRTFWDGEIGSALGFVAKSADPKICGRYFGTPESIVLLVDMLSTYAGFLDAGIAFVDRWLASLTPGSDLTRTPVEALGVILLLDPVERELAQRPALAQVRDSILAGHIEVGTTPAIWAQLPSRVEKERGAGDRLEKALCSALEAAAWPTADAELLSETLFQVSMLAAVQAMEDLDWTAQDESDVGKRLDVLGRSLREKGGRNLHLRRSPFPTETWLFASRRSIVRERMP